MGNSPLTPAQEAEVDQQIAAEGATLDLLVETFRRLTETRSTVQAALDLGAMVQQNGSHEDAVSLLIVAIMRLAECRCGP